MQIWLYMKLLSNFKTTRKDSCGSGAFDFGNYNHRVTLGEKLIDIVNAEKTGKKYEKIIYH